MNKGIFTTVGLLAAVVTLIFSLQFLRFQDTGPLTPEQLQKYNTVLLGTPRQLSPVPLLDKNSDDFTINDFAGNWSLVNFGYTHCPDVCPTNLLTLSKIMNLMESEGTKLPQIYMATVDPKRDTPARLAEYLEFFDPRMEALWSDEQTMSDFARQLNNLFLKGKEKTELDYLVDHSDNIAILNNDGVFVGIFRPPHQIEDIAFVMTNLMSQ